VEHGLQQLEKALVPPGYEVLQVVGTQRWRQVWKQRLVVATLVSSDVLLALLVWWLASALQGIWGRGPLSGVTVATMVPVIAAWVGLRALLVISHPVLIEFLDLLSILRPRLRKRGCDTVDAQAVREPAYPLQGLLGCDRCVWCNAVSMGARTCCARDSLCDYGRVR
jgi:hypothetical protein